MNPTLQLLSAIGTIIGSVAFATWVLSNKISTMRSDIVAELALLKTDLAVMKNSAEARDEKINKMWAWWLTALERGWVNHMKSLSEL
jgi:hypothetical protein